jgi:uncharacterized protein YjbI with pentapeptide repeats
MKRHNLYRTDLKHAMLRQAQHDNANFTITIIDEYNIC